jgi:RNA polymerase sigma-70 factor (ECF subfamily)
MIGAMANHLGISVQVGSDLRDFGTWMTSEQRRIYLLCRRMLQDPDEADSATQDVFLKAYRALSKTAGKPSELENPSKWVTRIAVNTCLDRLRSKRWKVWQRRPASEDEQFILQTIPDADPDAESRLFATQIQQRLEKALARLTDRQRAVFSLRHYDALPLEEIAATLKLDVGTVKAHLFRAIGKLREELKDLYRTREGDTRRTT